jgi:AcrR family transcriptional regulator
MNRIENTRRIQLRKTPQQERSIQRVDAIVAAASELIGKYGVNGMKMAELARLAGVPIGSVYQYFPEKAAIVKALFDRHAMGVQGMTAQTFQEVTSLEQAADKVCMMIDWYYTKYREDPIYLAVWLGTETDRDLLRLNIIHSNRVGVIFREAVERFLPEGHGIDLEARFNLLSHLIGASIRLAVMNDDGLARRMLAEWKVVIREVLFGPAVGPIA